MRTMPTDEKRTEHCGRCAMSTVVDTSVAELDDDERARRDPYGGSRIEVDEARLRSVSPTAWLSGLVSKLDDVATRLTYGR